MNNIFNYRITYFDEIVLEGATSQPSQEEALSYLNKKVIDKVKKSMIPNLKITINNRNEFIRTKLFDRPIAKKLQGKNELPWK